MLVPATHEQLGTIRHWFLPERPGPTIAQHVLATGVGRCLVDRFPQPRAVVVSTADNYTLAGDADVLEPADVRREVVGFVDAPPEFTRLIRAAVDEVHEWPRVIFTLEGPFEEGGQLGGFVIRRLEPGDAGSLAGLDAEISWASKTWGGPEGLAASGMGWGAFAGARLVAVCCPACAQAVCRDVRRRGRIPTWTTAPENAASLRVAAKLGAKLQRRDRLLVVGMPVPAPAQRPPM